VWAGPPFVTDDPEPVELHHWEVYVSSVTTRTPFQSNGTLPHVEVNNGAAPNLQLHMILPCSSSHLDGESTSRGLGDTELGVKYRFVQETKSTPMVGVFPLLEVPTGDPGRGLGTGHLQVFLPIWVQKSWGPWTSYGGGGYFVNPGAGNQSFWLFGWEVQKDLSEHWTLGGELFNTTPNSPDAPNRFNFNLGGFYNIDDGHHILFSAGRGISGDVEFMSYLGYQWTFGPRESGKG
jgi:PPE-repeat protein